MKLSNWKISTLLQKSLLIAPERRNVGTNERILSSTLGAFLGTLGYRRIGKGGTLLMLPAGYLLWRAASGYCFISEAMGWDSTEGTESFRLRQSVIIQRPPDEVYNAWHKFENLPKYLKHVKSVKMLNDGRYEWTATFNDQDFKWKAEILEDIPNRKISWRSVEPADVENYGSVDFIKMSENDTTRLRLNLIYRPAKTEWGRIDATFLTPIFRKKVKNDLRKFRDLMDVTGQPVGAV